MSKTKFSKLVIGLSILLASMTIEQAAMASKGSAHAALFSSGDEPPHHSGGVGTPDMMLDVSMNYVRDMKTDGASDSAARFSLGGMFNQYLALDAVGLLEMRSKSYLVGSDLRVSPTDWLFLKGGVGVYSDKVSHSLNFTPMAGAGIMAHIDRTIYLVTEGSYFQVSNSNNLSIGAGLGVMF